MTGYVEEEDDNGYKDEELIPSARKWRYCHDFFVLPLDDCPSTLHVQYFCFPPLTGKSINQLPKKSLPEASPTATYREDGDDFRMQQSKW